MLPLVQILNERQRLETELASRHVVRAGVFGWTARGDARPDSDIDVLVEMSPEACSTARSALYPILRGSLLHRADGRRDARIQRINRMACGSRNREHFRDAIVVQIAWLDPRPRPNSAFTIS
jgi:predicted nucleotidyltransferase